jgi:hypothetical protein
MSTWATSSFLARSSPPSRRRYPRPTEGRHSGADRSSRSAVRNSLAVLGRAVFGDHRPPACRSGPSSASSCWRSSGPSRLGSIILYTLDVSTRPEAVVDTSGLKGFESDSAAQTGTGRAIRAAPPRARASPSPPAEGGLAAPPAEPAPPAAVAKPEPAPEGSRAQAHARHRQGGGATRRHPHVVLDFPAASSSRSS